MFWQDVEPFFFHKKGTDEGSCKEVVRCYGLFFKKA